MESGEKIDILLAKYLAETASEQEKQDLRTWIKLSASNAQYFEDFKRLYLSVEAADSNWQPDVEAAFKNVTAKIEAQAKLKPLFTMPRIWAAAAAVAAIVLSVLFLKQPSADKVEPILLSIADVKAVQHNSLPDGSGVTLNKGASLKYSTRKGHRFVELEGEAFFEVKHDSIQQFEVQAGKLLITDIGTAFNVKKLDNGDVEVLVTEGEVQLTSVAGDVLNLVAGEAAYYSGLTDKLEKRLPENVSATAKYATRDFDFNSIKLDEIIKQVNEAYHVTIKVENQKLKNCLFSVSFHDEDIDMVISVIAETLGMQVEERDGIILLKGGTCQ